MTIDGGCHCGNIRFVLRWPEGESTIGARRCACTFCRKHGGVWTSHRDADLDIEITDPSSLSAYSFGTRTAQFLVCTACGVVPAVVSEIEGGLYAVVNVNAFADSSDLSLAEQPTDFDGEGVGDRLGRRRRNWIPRVSVHGFGGTD